MRVLYIGGYGRSGSSLLDATLGAGPGVFGAGELCNLFILADDPNATCNCGAPYEQCVVWGEVLAAVSGTLGLSPSEAEQVRHRSESSLRLDPRYVSLWSTVFDRVAEVTGATVITDSSKTSYPVRYRPMRLAEAGLDVRLVHLVRDPAGVLCSSVKGRNRDLAAGKARSRLPFVPAVSWLLSNLVADGRGRRKLATPNVNVVFEEFVSDPGAVLGPLGEQVGVDLTDVIARVTAGEPLSTGHGVAGNRMRSSGPIVFKAPDGEVRDASVAIRALAGPLRFVGRQAGWFGPR